MDDYHVFVPEQLTTTQEIDEWLESTWHSVWAKVAGRDDVQIFHGAGVRVVDGALQVNAGTVRQGTQESNWRPRYDWQFPEWLPALQVYVKHTCEGCAYPPNMCCLQGYGDDD